MLWLYVMITPWWLHCVTIVIFIASFVDLSTSVCALHAVVNILLPSSGFPSQHIPSGTSLGRTLLNASHNAIATYRLLELCSKNLALLPSLSNYAAPLLSPLLPLLSSHPIGNDKVFLEWRIVCR
ncbi:hypothetical protein BDQ17DRAFT_841851 [Cyathus striatus]|nr:hypothetical protein BDQ17DRAFT_841851 [Cyathus striatus]